MAFGGMGLLDNFFMLQIQSCAPLTSVWDVDLVLPQGQAWKRKDDSLTWSWCSWL